MLGGRLMVKSSPQFKKQNLLKVLRSTGFAKSMTQNIDVKELRYQNIENKGLMLHESASRDHFR